MFALARRFSATSSADASGWRIVLPTGIVVYLNLHDPRFIQVVTELLATHNWDLLKRYLHEGDTFVDIGANHGSFSILASSIVGARGRVVAFEPQATLAKLVRQSLDANANSTAEVVCAACGQDAGTTDFFVPLESSGSATIFAAYAGPFRHKTFRVPLVRFDEAVDWRAFPGDVLLKLDVEGSELAFLQGARRFIQARRPTILMEVNPRSLRSARVDPRDLQSELRSLGYEQLTQCETGAVLPLDALVAERFGNIVLTGSAVRSDGYAAHALP